MNFLRPGALRLGSFLCILLSSDAHGEVLRAYGGERDVRDVQGVYGLGFHPVLLVKREYLFVTVVTQVIRLVRLQRRFGVFCMTEEFHSFKERTLQLLRASLAFEHDRIFDHRQFAFELLYDALRMIPFALEKRSQFRELENVLCGGS